jgi:hypothetical protein
MDAAGTARQKIESWLFELARVARAFRSRCPHHHKRESRRDVIG